MIYKIAFAEQALVDLHLAADYIKFKLCNKSAAQKLVQDFFREADALTTFPTRNPLCNDKILRSWEIRFLPIKNYLLFYVVKEATNTVYIVRFLYKKRSWQKILHEQAANEQNPYIHTFTTNYVQESKATYNISSKN